MSRGSQRSLVSSRGPASGVAGASEQKGSSSMKCIITVGVILPILAAIIGIAAWSLTSDSAHKRSPSSSLYHGGRTYYRNGDQVFEERNDNDDLVFGQKVPIGGAVSKDVLGPEVEEERDVLPPADQFPENDPLYVVHYVPRGHKESSSEPPIPSPPPDVLSKILAAGKAGSGKGTPQFVVFAPMTHEGDNEEDHEDHSSRVTRQRVKTIKKLRTRIQGREEMDDEYVDNTEQRPHIHEYEEDRQPRRHHKKNRPSHQVEFVPKRGYYDSSEHQQNNYNNGYQNQQNNHHQTCCNMPQPSSTMMPAMTTEPPKGFSITLGQGIPLGPLGMLRAMLRPKVDLRKKVFFGVQLDNGIGFGGDAPAAAMPLAAQAPAMGGHMGGGGMIQKQNNGGGITYHFG